MKQKLRQPLSILLTLLMLLALLPATAFAADGGDGAENPYAHEDHTDYTEWTNAGVLPNTAGKYYLSNDITLSANWDVPGETVLCLNGHNIKLNAYHFEVGEDEHLVICDCSTAVHQGYLDPDRYYLWTPGKGGDESCDLTGGVIYGGVCEEEDTGSCIDSNGGDVTLAGGNIAGNLNYKDAWTDSNGTVRIVDGNFTMYGGSVTGNYVYNYGGGIYIASSSNDRVEISLYGGKISHNIADYGAGGVNVGRLCDFLLAGGAIEYNIAGFERGSGYGGGVLALNDSTVKIESGRICYNTAKGFGAGLRLSGSGYSDRDFFTMTGGLIQGNFVSDSYGYGGAISASGCKMEITGGTIVENAVKGNGGGISAGNSNLTIGEAVTIGGNTAGNGGSDIYYNPSQYGGTTLKLAKPQNDGDAERYWFDDTPEKRYEGNESSVNKYGSINSTKAKYLIAATGIPAYAIDVDTIGYGSITADPSGEVAADTEITLTVTPEKGYELKEGSLKVTYTTDDGEQTVPVTDNKFNMPAADVTVSAEFVATEYDITYELDGGANAEGNPDTYTVEDAITLSAPTRAGYTFTGWTWDGQNEPQTTVNLAAGSVTGNLTFTANWKIKLPDVPVVDPDDDDDDDDEPGTVTPDDTGVSDWLDTKNHIQYLSGYGEGKFGPEDNMTRAQAAQMFYNLLLDKDVAITVSFSDVAENAWYAEAVNTLASLGIVDGVGGGLYAPERAITRAEFTVIAMRFAHLDTGGENIFSDVSRSDWFYDQVVGSVKYGWINGYADGTFRPNNTITRAEVTTIVNRMLGRSADRGYVDANIGSLTQFNDISRAHWAYYEVMEAANAHDYAIVNGKEDWK